MWPFIVHREKLVQYVDALQVYGNFARLAVRCFGLVPTESGCGSRRFSLNPDLDLLNPDRIQALLNPNRIQALLNPDKKGILAVLNPG